MLDSGVEARSACDPGIWYVPRITAQVLMSDRQELDTQNWRSLSSIPHHFS
jgi:hypothetical protein